MFCRNQEIRVRVRVMFRVRVRVRSSVFGNESQSGIRTQARLATM